MTEPQRREVAALLGCVTLSALRRRLRERVAPPETPTEPRLVPSASRPWLRRIARHPVALVFLTLGAATTFTLVFAATRLADDGNLSAADWFRLIIVGIIAVAFLARVVSILGRLPPIRWIRAALKRPTTPLPTATIPSIEVDEIGTLATGFGRLTSTERSRIRTQTTFDDMFWVAVNLALMVLGGLALFGLGFSALRDIFSGESGVWSYIRLAMSIVAALGLARLLRASIGQLRLRRQRRRKRVTKRVLRYLLWWDSPAPAVVSASRFGPARATLAGLSPFLIVGIIAAAAAGFSPWGEAPVAVAGESFEAAVVAQPPLDSVTGATTTTTGATTTTTVAPTTTTAGATTTTTVAPTTTTAGATTTTTVAPTTTTAGATTTTAGATTTTTVAPTTTTQPPAPLMVVHSLTHTFNCPSGTTVVVAWSVSGDGAGNVHIFRLRSDGFFEQIGFYVAFNANLVDTLPGTGNYQYWLFASNSDGIQTVTKDPGSGFFSSNGGCID